MVKLFKIEGYSVDVTPEALLLKPFRDIWESDESESKDIAMMKLAYIYYMEDPRSDYQYIVDRQSRKAEVLKGLGFDNFIEDDLILKACDLYKSFKPISAGLLEDTRYVVDKLRKELREMDFNERDDKGKPVYTLQTITATLKQIPALIKDLDEAEKALNKDIMAESQARGSQTKALLEDED